MRQRRLSIAAVVLFSFVAGATVFWHERVKPLPFESALWKASDAKVRFRMKDSLVCCYQSGTIATRADVDDQLGHDDEQNDPQFRMFSLYEWYGNPWYMRIRFDEQGKIIDLGAHPS